MIKKPKIINISLNSPKEASPNAIHMVRDQSHQQLHNYNQLKLQQIIDDCYEAIRIITVEKVKHLQKEKRLTKVQSESIRVLKKTEKQSDIKLPYSIGESVEMILKRFIKFKIQENQQKMKGNHTKQRKLQQITHQYKSLFMKYNKENTEGSVYNQANQEVEADIFRNVSLNSKNNDKLQHKINALQSQVNFLKEKLAQKNLLIAKLQAKQILLRKKYLNQANKMIRSKNILNINTIFQKEVQQKQDGKYLLNIYGKNMKKTKMTDKYLLDQSCKSVSSRAVDIPAIKSREKKEVKQVLKTSPSQAFIKTIVKKSSYLQKVSGISIQQSLKSLGLVKKVTQPPLSVFQSPRRQTSRISELKKQLDQFYRSKQKAIEDLNQNNHKIVRAIQQIDQKIIKKMKQISAEEELLTDQELKMLKQEDFQTLQLNGFYDNPDFKYPNALTDSNQL